MKLGVKVYVRRGETRKTRTMSFWRSTGCDDPDFHYRFGIDLFIRGVQAMAEQG